MDALDELGLSSLEPGSQPQGCVYSLPSGPGIRLEIVMSILKYNIMHYCACSRNILSAWACIQYVMYYTSTD